MRPCRRERKQKQTRSWECVCSSVEARVAAGAGASAMVTGAYTQAYKSTDMVNLSSWMLWRKLYFLELFSLSYTTNWSPGGHPCNHKAGADIAVSSIMQPEFSAAQKGSVLLMGLLVRVAYLMLSHILSNRVGNKSYLCLTSVLIKALQLKPC